MATSDDSLMLRKVVQQVARMSTSLRVLGVFFVLLALPYAATGYGLLVAWAPAWLGVLLWQAGAAAQRDEPVRAMRKLRQFFAGFSALAAVLLLFAFVMAVVPYATVVDTMSALGL